MITLHEISKFYGEKRVLDKVSLTLPEGRVTALTGRSGSGKTTLSRILLGLEKADGGRVTGASGLKKAAVFQEDRLIEHLSALENLLLVGATKEEARRHLEALGLGADLDVRALKLSGGMRRRLALARAMVAGADLIVLDEPMTGLDEANKRLAGEYVLENQRHAAVLLISHDPEDLEILGASGIFSLDRAECAPRTAT
jgi:NitT/TauT family transport system ATP-binding protein